ncbi:NAD(P)/FAD-dependent oxidoreductase [Nocardia sp. NPDC059177]|uniref:NAD(P)/FAD-dependent oxidoreductase n=1 Tax=Nocardia sp. NPDC059177 TaxID=3346759 RepID=UPI0036B5D8A5
MAQLIAGGAMKSGIDCVVIGGGVAGLMIAARLAGAGMSVRLIERDLLGAGATTSNHGLIHSGALYARWHPEIVATCAQAQIAYRTAFPDCVVATQPCWYYGTPETMHTYRRLWRRHDIVNHRVDGREINEILRVHGRDVAACATSELVIDTHALLNDLAAHCVVLGVEIVVGVKAARILLEDRRVHGVATAQGLTCAPIVVVCAGIGTRALLDDAGSMIGTALSSRLEMLTAYPGVLSRPLIGLEFGWPALAPTATGVVLASRYGGVQPAVTKAGRWPVPTGEAAALDAELRDWLAPGIIEHGRASAWVCSKTEHLGTDADRWGTSPNYAVIDHTYREQLHGLWTVLPGKMTLAMHASREVAIAITGTALPLAMTAGRAAPGDACGLVAGQPWVSESMQEAR